MAGSDAMKKLLQQSAQRKEQEIHTSILAMPFAKKYWN